MTAAGALVIRARHLVPIASPPIENGWLRIAGGRIVALGRGVPPGPAVDLGDAIVLPGLVNAHTHLEFSSLRQPLDVEGGLPEWIRRVVSLRRDRDSAPAPDERAAAMRAGLEEAAAAGVTAVGEIATSWSAADAAPRGPRLRVYRETLGLSRGAIAAAARGLDRDLDRLAACGIPAGISPHAPYSVAAPLAKRVCQAAARRRLPVAMHVAESMAEEELLASGTGAFRRLLEDLGAWDAAAPPTLLPAADWISRLARGPRGIVVHGTHLGRDAAAVARLARHRDRLCVAVCPRTTRALSGVLPPLEVFRGAGLRVAIGTDSRASNPDLSVLAECRTLVDAGLVGPAEALAMATIHGAWALMFDRLVGRLAPGFRADLVVLRPGAAGGDPCAAVLDPSTAVVATLRGGRVIAGRLPG